MKKGFYNLFSSHLCQSQPVLWLSLYVYTKVIKGDGVFKKSAEKWMKEKSQPKPKKDWDIPK